MLDFVRVRNHTSRGNSGFYVICDPFYKSEISFTTCSVWSTSIANINASKVSDIIPISICFIGIFSTCFNFKLCLGSVCIRDEKSTAAFALPGICARSMLYPINPSMKFHNAEWSDFDWKKSRQSLFTGYDNNQFFSSRNETRKVFYCKADRQKLPKKCGQFQLTCIE